MKKILIVLLLSFSYVLGNSQVIVNRAGAANTVSDARLQARLNLLAPRYTDTTVANITANIGIDSCGALIYTYNTQSLWYRQCSPKKWVEFTVGGGTSVTVSSYGKNASGDSTILLLSNGVRYAAKDSVGIDGVDCEGLLTGGIVTWDSLLVFSVSGATYCINNVPYRSLSQSITLDPADPTLDRIDVIGLDTFGLVFKITGTPAADPSIPQIDGLSQLYLTSVFVGAGATNPGDSTITPPPSNVIIWNENLGAPTEYVASASGLTSNFNYTAVPANVYAPVKSSDIGAFTVNDIVTYTGTPAYSTTTYPVLRFFIKNKLAISNNAAISIQLMSGGVVRTSSFLLGAANGFSKTNITTFQNVSINIADFQFFQLTPTIDGIRFITTGNGGGFYIDYITLNGGVVNSNTNTPLSLAPIGNNPNANAASLANNVLNLEPANPSFGGVVTASNIPQFLKGQKGIISATDTIQSWYQNSTLRSWLRSDGKQFWIINGGSGEIGSVGFSSPNNLPGIQFAAPAGFSSGRSQIRQYIDTGGISIGSVLSGVPDNQLVVLNNGNTFITGFSGDRTGIGARTVTDLGYGFNVTKTTKLTDSLTLGNVPTGIGTDSVLVKTASGLVKKISQASLAGSGNDTAYVAMGTAVDSSYILLYHSNRAIAPDTLRAFGNAVIWGGIGGTLSDQTDLQTALNAKQATLVSATNIKTVNGNTLLGSGDLAINAGTTTPQTLTDGATVTFNASLGTSALVTLGGNRTLSITNMNNGDFLSLLVIQDGTGSRTLTLPASTKVISGGGGAVTLTTAAAAQDILTFWKINSVVYCNYGKNYN